MTRTKVINLYGGPGAGKSTTAAGLFHKLKLQGYDVELVTEYAKALVWDERQTTLQDQLYILAKQNRCLARLLGKVDYIVTDSPLLLGLYYVSKDFLPNTFPRMVEDLYNTYDNIEILLRRVKPYNKIGRLQTEDEARAIDEAIRGILSECDTNIFKRYEFDGDEEAVDKIVHILVKYNHVPEKQNGTYE